MNHTRRTWATVDLTAAEENINKIRSIVGDDCAIMSVVKADGYGHGAVEISKTIDKNTDYFAVSNIDEAIQIRVGGIEKPILILGYTPPRSMDLIAKYGVTQTVFSYDYGKMLAQAPEDMDNKAIERLTATMLTAIALTTTALITLKA